MHAGRRLFGHALDLGATFVQRPGFLRLGASRSRITPHSSGSFFHRTRDLAGLLALGARARAASRRRRHRAACSDRRRATSAPARCTTNTSSRPAFHANTGVAGFSTVPVRPTATGGGVILRREMLHDTSACRRRGRRGLDEHRRFRTVMCSEPMMRAPSAGSCPVSVADRHRRAFLLGETDLCAEFGSDRSPPERRTVRFCSISSATPIIPLECCHARNTRIPPE